MLGGCNILKLIVVNDSDFMDNIGTFSQGGAVMETNLEGRIKNTSRKESQDLFPLFEAVVNSIHAIEEYHDIGVPSGYIRVEIIRQDTGYLFDEPTNRKEKAIVGFKIVDNGVGFNEENLKSFNTLDSDHKQQKGCRGIGRLLWLKFFAMAKISSIYKANGLLFRRSFSFNSARGVHNEENTEALINSKMETCVTLDGFNGKTSVHKNLKTIAWELLEHCLWFFLRGENGLSILVADSDKDILLNNLYDDFVAKNIYQEKIIIKNIDFFLFHIKLKRNIKNASNICYCADDRPVKYTSIIPKLSGFHGTITESGISFHYMCMVSSEYLDANVSSDRDRFDGINDEPSEILPDEISFAEMERAVLENIEAYLKNDIERGLQESRARLLKFVVETAPRYRSLVNIMEEKKFDIDPSFSDSELELALHKELYKVESEVLEEGHEILCVPDEMTDEYKARLAQYMKKIETLKQSDLASYVAKRRVVIDLLGKHLEMKSNGKYSMEESIHQLIVPMRKDSNEFAADEDNLWLIDERMVFHHYLASDKKISSMHLEAATSMKEPDLCHIQMFDTPLLVSESQTNPTSITIVEFKRPMRENISNEKDDPLTQVLKYLEDIRAGRRFNDSGRPLIGLSDAPGFCYIICDLTSEYSQRCHNTHDLTLGYDKKSFFGYRKNLHAYIEIISYDALVERARQRNQAFFDKLGLPCTR